MSLSSVFTVFYVQLNSTYYNLLTILLNSTHHLRYLSMKCPYPELRKKMWIKMGNQVGEDAYINHSITILDSPNLKTNIILGNRVALSPNIIFITGSSPNKSQLKNFESNQRYFREAPIEIGDDTWIGAGTTIHPGIKIGKRCIIGSMSNVTKNIPDDSLAYGNPIIIRRKIND